MFARDAIREIKSDFRLRQIPLVVLTTSQGKEDIAGSYDLDVSSYIGKPVTFEGLVNVMRGFGRYSF
jgi:CheY-like chemotaxis protein